MSPKEHYALMWRVQFYGIGVAAICLVAFVLSALDNRSSLVHQVLSLCGLYLSYEAQLLTSALLYGGIVIVCLVTPRIVFRWFIPAQCPQCASKAYLRVISPVRYICQNCGYCAATEDWGTAR